MSKPKTMLTVVFLSMLLSACGFKAHDWETSNLAGKSVYIESHVANETFDYAITQVAQQYHITKAVSSKNANIVIHIISLSTSQKSPSFNASSQMRIYPITLALRYSMMEKDTVLLANQQIILRKDLVIHTNKTQYMNNQLQKIVVNMYQQAAKQLLQQLAMKSKL